MPRQHVTVAHTRISKCISTDITACQVGEVRCTDTEMEPPEAWLGSPAQDKSRTRCRMEHTLYTLTKGLILANLLDSGVLESCMYRNFLFV